MKGLVDFIHTIRLKMSTASAHLCILQLIATPSAPYPALNRQESVKEEKGKIWMKNGFISFRPWHTVCKTLHSMKHALMSCRPRHTRCKTSQHDSGSSFWAMLIALQTEEWIDHFASTLQDFPLRSASVLIKILCCTLNRPKHHYSQSIKTRFRMF